MGGAAVDSTEVDADEDEEGVLRSGNYLLDDLGREGKETSPQVLNLDEIIAISPKLSTGDTASSHEESLLNFHVSNFRNGWVSCNETRTSTNVEAPSFDKNGPATEVESIYRDEIGTTFQVMKIVSDKQDLGFVEKVHIPERQILQLCKQLVPGSIECLNFDAKINFQMLNSLSMPCVGLYGDKLMMARVLKDVGAIDSSTIMKMQQDSFEPGLYVCPMKHCIALFYWHQGSRMEDAARKQISCNFIRYLVDLCDDVCVFVEGDNLMAALSASDSIAKAKYKRTKRLKVSHVQNSANDVSVSLGFRLTLEMDMGLQTPVAFLGLPSQSPFFCQGHHRCALITPAYKESYQHAADNTISISTGELPSKLKDWFHNYEIDFSDLQNEEFALLLQHSGLPEYQRIMQFEQSIKSRYDLEERNLSVVSKLEDTEKRVSIAFVLALPEICRFLKYLPEWHSDGSLAESSSGSPFEQLERVLSGVWNGQKMVYVGSMITLSCSDGSSFNCLVELGESQSYGPLLFDQKFKLSKVDGSTSQASFRKNDAAQGTPVLAGEKVQLHDGPASKGGLVITEVETPIEAIKAWLEEMLPVRLQNIQKNFLLLCFLMSDGIAEQLKKLGDEFVAQLAAGARSDVKEDLVHLLAAVRVSDEPSLNFEKTKNFLLFGDVSIILSNFDAADAAESNLPSDSLVEDFTRWRRKFAQFTLDENAVGKGNLFVNDWKALCKELCDFVKETFKESVLSMMGRNMSVALKKRLEKAMQDEKKRLTERFEEEKDSFLLEIKTGLHGGPAGATRRKMCIKNCTVGNKRFYYVGTQKLKIRLSSEEIEKSSIQWMITEVAPTKKDLDEICLNPMHSISPLCSQTYEVLKMDPEIEEMKMIVFLKSGELLIFVMEKVQNCLYVYISAKIGFHLSGSNRIHTFRRGFNLIAFEESTRFLALYDAQISKVRIHRFDETFRHVDWTGVELSLDAFSGSCNLIGMLCIPRKPELLLLDHTNRIRVAELHHQPLMKPRNISLPSSYVTSCISEDGFFLFVLLERCYPSCEEESTDRVTFPEVHVYLLGDSMTFLKRISLDIELQEVTDLQLKLVVYGGQRHLVAFNKSFPDNVLISYVLKITSATEVLQFEEVSKNKLYGERLSHAASDDSVRSSATLDYLYHIFDKFAIQPTLGRDDDSTQSTCRNQKFHVLLKAPPDGLDEVLIMDRCNNYMNSLLKRIEKEKGKEFWNYKVQFHPQMFDSWKSGNSQNVFFLDAQKKAIGDWMRQLVCLVPVQICRADNNAIQPLVDGLQISSDMNYADSISLASLLRFGMYDAILSQWDGNIKVISSMGKQSSGKSYLLNHLSGSLLDVAGGRCTDGVWMTVRVVSNCLYVLLDFEGLGSFERTEQEDMLLSVLNAAMSNLTIFNKKDFHLDKETEAVFHRFQDGVSLVKHDEKLFKGLFYVAIKDVDASDVEELKEEFHKKLLQICQRSKENFLTKMYGGEVEIAAMPPFSRQEYHKESLLEIASTIEELDHNYKGGRSFLRDLKIVIAQIAAKDWTPVDLKRVAMKIDILRKSIVTAIRRGCLLSGGCLMNFDTEEETPDGPFGVADLEFGLADTGLELIPSEESRNIESILDYLRTKFELVLKRKDMKVEEWHSNFQEYLQALAERRKDRVEMWIRSNTSEFLDNNEVQKLQLEVSLTLAELKQGMTICGSKCSKCFWRCLLNKAHPSDHSCMGSHVCTEQCSYCSMGAAVDGKVWECQSPAGHEGDHDCKKRNHTCGNICRFYSSSSNCSKSCSLKIGHEGDHKCNSPQHVCNKNCSLPGCRNSCVIQIEAGDHEKHVCHERYCPRKCVMKGCRRSCGYEDHFHQLTSNKHLCGSKHPCREKCQEEGICEIFTELVRQTRSFSGRRGSFEYEHVSEQNVLRKGCCIPIPPFELRHRGPHIHTRTANAVHYCDTKCQACGYFCQLPIHHPGLHNTVHGNMRNVKFCSDKAEFDILDRKYAWGESGMAEMCNMHCKAQGRGHVHLSRCPGNKSCSILIYDGARHETRKYGPDFDVPKDELTHESYWQQMRFMDPCTEEDRIEFGLCNHICNSEEHAAADGSFTKSYCTETLWHEPLTVASVASVGGHITRDGHAFACNHSRNVPHHVIFVIDKSGSMSCSDILPTVAKVCFRHSCRLGCVYEAILRFIVTRRKTTTDDILSVVLFDSYAWLALEMAEMREDVVDALLSYEPGGATSYSAGLKMAEDVLIRGCKHPNHSKMKPIIIFLSDGGNNDGMNPVHFVNNLKKADPRISVHTIMFGKDPAKAVLQQMAAYGNGTFQLTLDEVQLAQSFESLATSLKPTVAALV